MVSLGIITDIVKGIPDFVEVVTGIRERRKKARGTTSRILQELELNLDLLYHEFPKGEIPAAKVLEALSCEALQDALKEGFDFSLMKKGKIPAVLTSGDKYLESRTGADLQDLIRQLATKIMQLKRLPLLYSNLETNKLRLGIRLGNLLKLIMLTLRFITYER